MTTPINVQPSTTTLINPMLPGDPNAGTTAATAGGGSAGASAAGGILGAGMQGAPEGLTAEGLMLYLQTRMNGLDEQINAIFGKQQDIEKVRKLLAEMQTELNELKDDASVKELQGEKHAQGADLADYEQKINDLLDALEEIDPALAESLRGQLQHDGQILYDQDGLYFTKEVGNSRELINTTMKQLESSAQMEMIRLQSLMSARGTAMQLTTNMIASLHEPIKTIVGNVGR